MTSVPTTTVISSSRAPPPPVFVLLSMTDLFPAPSAPLLLHTKLLPAIKREKTPIPIRSVSPRFSPYARPTSSPLPSSSVRATTSPLSSSGSPRTSVAPGEPTEAPSTSRTVNGLIERPVGGQLMTLSKIKSISMQDCRKIQVRISAKISRLADTVYKQRIRALGPTILVPQLPYTQQRPDAITELEKQVRYFIRTAFFAAHFPT